MDLMLECTVTEMLGKAACRLAKYVQLHSVERYLSPLGTLAVVKDFCVA